MFGIDYYVFWGFGSIPMIVFDLQSLSFNFLKGWGMIAINIIGAHIQLRMYSNIEMMWM